MFNIRSLAIRLLALLIAFTLHEFAHAYVAKKEGDYTAAAYRRCTPEALVHFDIIGFLMMIFFGFGWAKPVPVNKNNFKRNLNINLLIDKLIIDMCGDKNGNRWSKN